MQTVSLGGNLHEVSDPIVGKLRKLPPICHLLNLPLICVVLHKIDVISLKLEIFPPTRCKAITYPFDLITAPCALVFSKIIRKQEAHGPRFAHLSDIVTADMQMLCNIFPILLSQLMKISSSEQFLVLKKNIWA